MAAVWEMAPVLVVDRTDWRDAELYRETCLSLCPGQILGDEVEMLLGFSISRFTPPLKSLGIGTVGACNHVDCCHFHFLLFDLYHLNTSIPH